MAIGGAGPGGSKIGYSTSVSLKGGAPQPLKEMEREVLRHANAGRPAEALQLCERILQDKPRHVEAINFSGILRAQLGDMAGAEARFRQVLKHEARHFDALNNLGNIAMQSGRLDDAQAFYERARRVRPDHPSLAENLKQVQDALAEIDAAVAAAEAEIATAPDDPKAHLRLGHALLSGGRHVPAIRAFRKAGDLAPADPAVHREITAVVGGLALPDYSREVEEALIWCFENPLSYHVELGRAAAHLLVAKYELETTPPSRVAARAGDDTLLRHLLTTTVNADVRLELFLTALRRRAMLEPGVLPDGLVAALAQQCFNNEYVFVSDIDETTHLDALVRRVEAVSDPDALAGMADDLLRVALYRPLAGLANADTLATVPPEAWPEKLRRLVRLTLHDTREEAALRDGFPALTPIDDTVSQAVQAQYEAHPYPRWVQLPTRPKIPVGQVLARQFPDYEANEALNSDGYDVLVAGCGTGWHPINVAMVYEGARVLAVDLSRTSLAYAARMAERHGVDNIDFAQADILGLGALDRRFALIESIGVLHHMADPSKGWEVLTGLLKPGGILKLGLYSERARQVVVAARDRIAHEKVPSTTEAIHAFRGRLIAEGVAGPLAPLLVEPDFFSVSTCRDLLFHVQEHRYTPARLAEEIEKNGLRFLGFELNDPALVQMYRERFPDDPALTKLGNWARFEDAVPDALTGYEFWCQKPTG